MWESAALWARTKNEIAIVPNFRHTSHLGVELLFFVQRDTLIDKSSCHANLGLHLCEFMLNRLCKNKIIGSHQKGTMTKCDREPASWKVFCRRLCAASRTVSSPQTWIQNEHKREYRWSNVPAAIRSLGNKILYSLLLVEHWLEGEHLRKRDPLCPCDIKQKNMKYDYKHNIDTWCSY